MGAGVSNLADTRQAIADQLAAAGVDRVTLTRTETAPFVFVGLPVGLSAVGIGAWHCEYPITAVYLSPGDVNAATWALEQVEKIVGALGFAVFRPTSWGDDQWPAYLLTYPRDVPNPNC